MRSGPQVRRVHREVHGCRLDRSAAPGRPDRRCLGRQHEDGQREVSATIPTIALEPFCPPRTWVDMMLPPLPPGGAFARRVGERLLLPGFGTVAGSTADRSAASEMGQEPQVAWYGRSGRNVCHSCGVKLRPATAHASLEPVGLVDVPDPARAGVGDHHDAATVRGEEGGGRSIDHRPRERVAEPRSARHIPQEDVSGCVRADGDAPVRGQGQRYRCSR